MLRYNTTDIVQIYNTLMPHYIVGNPKSLSSVTTLRTTCRYVTLVPPTTASSTTTPASPTTSPTSPTTSSCKSI